jgi:hypothetical protein
MYDVNVEVMERLGFNWSNSGRGRINGSGDPNSLLAINNNTVQGSGVNTSNMTPAAAAVATATSPAVGSLFTLGHFSRHLDLKSTIQALETTDGSRLLARPNIVAYDLVEASFQSVQEIPVQQLTQTEAGGNIGTTEFREAGITLTVLPRIMTDNSILLQVTPEFSVLNGFNNGQPIIDRRQATTTLSLMNGQAAVIGGLVRRNEIERDSGVPGVLHWKYFGRLFRGHEATVTESELVVFIRAEVVESSFPGDPRDQMSHSTVEELLNQIPYANSAPVVGTCNDPYCPYHYPRQRSFGEYPADSKHAPGHHYKTPVQAHPHGDVYQSDGQRHPSEPTPAVDSRSGAPVPSVLHSPEPPVPTVRGANDSGSGSVQIPPPVIIDEMARRYRNGNAAISRLPIGRRETTQLAQQPTPIVVQPNRQVSEPVPLQAPQIRTANASGRRLPPGPRQARPRTTSPALRENWSDKLFLR